MGGAAFVFACRVAGAALVFVSQLLLARWMGAEQLGIYVYAFSLCVLLTTVAALGFPSAALRFITQSVVEKNHGRLNSFHRRAWSLGLISSALIAAIGCGVVFVSGPWIPESHKMALLVAMVSVPAYTLMRIYGGTAHALSWFRLALLPSLVFRPLLLLGVVVAVWTAGYTLSAESVMFFHLGVVMLLLLVQGRLVHDGLKRNYPADTTDDQTGLWLRTALPLLMTSLFRKNFLELNVIVVGLLLAVDQLAVFNVSLRLAFLIGFGIYAVDAITLPKIGRYLNAGDTEGLQRLVSHATQLKFWGALVAFILIVVVGKNVLGAFGPEFTEGYEALILFALSQVIVAALGPGMQILSISGHHHYCLVVSTCAAVLMLMLHAVLAPLFGLKGSAYAVLIVVLLEAVWLCIAVVRRLNLSPSVLDARRLLDTRR